MNRKAHCKECLEKMGDEWEHIHRWLDATARDYFPWMGHRQIRHHKEGVEQVRKLWGDEAAKAAEMHIISDFGKVPSKEEIRKRYGPSPFTCDKGAYPTYEDKSIRPRDWDGVREYN
jgi:hypothetical protein